MFDPQRWVEHLDRHRVEYILVGGFAANLHGARRPTMDIDVVPRWELANLGRLCAALREVDAVSTTGPETAGADIAPDVLVEREVMTWSTTLGRIDTMVGIPNRDGAPVDFDLLAVHASAVALGSTLVAVASLDDVIESKEFAGRRKDAEALPELRRLRATKLDDDAS